MKGAREYAPLFKTGRYGNLYIESDSHARGYTFRIFVLPAEHVGGERAQTAVEVYGITGGNPGWTETYGWLYRGPWEQDFARLLAVARARNEEARAKRAESLERERERKRDHIQHVLGGYVSSDRGDAA